MNLRPQRKPSPEINVTPLIDVVFLLLIFFMVSTTFNRETQISIDLPRADSAQPMEEQQLVEVDIDAQGHYFIHDQELPDARLQTVKDALVGAVGSARERPLIISADAKTPHQAVITVLDAARQVGITHLTFATQQARDER